MALALHLILILYLPSSFEAVAALRNSKISHP